MRSRARGLRGHGVGPSAPRPLPPELGDDQGLLCEPGPLGVEVVPHHSEGGDERLAHQADEVVVVVPPVDEGEVLQCAEASLDEIAGIPPGEPAGLPERQVLIDASSSKTLV